MFQPFAQVFARELKGLPGKPTRMIETQFVGGIGDAHQRRFARHLDRNTIKAARWVNINTLHLHNYRMR